MRKIFILNILIVVTTLIHNATCDKRQDELIMQRRSFLTFLDEEKLRSYLFSFGGSQTAEESRQHAVYKRASGRVRKLKKVPSPSASDAKTASSDDHFVPEPKITLNNNNNNRNLTISPRHMIKFEVEDAKYSEAYEQLKKSRKLRTKRSPPSENENVSAKNRTHKMEKFITPDTFMQPKEFLRFLLSDAITSQPRDTNYDKKMKEEKKTAKREVSAADAATVAAAGSDSTGSDSFKKVKITHPLSTNARTKHVSFEELPAKLQKMVESALTDAVTKGKANDGDYLKIYYGDKVIKIPVSMSKHIPVKVKETTTPKTTIIESYHKYKEESEAPALLGTKNTYYNIQDPPFKFESKKYYLPTTTEKSHAESYANFVTPKSKSPYVEEIHLPQTKTKSVYYFSSDDDATPFKSSVTSPGPVIFESSTPSSIFSDLSKNYGNSIVHPTSSPSLSAYKTIVKEVHRDTIPITEEIDDSLYYKALKSIPHIDEHKPIPIPPATSFIDFNGSTAGDEHVEKNYEFGYHISDYKTGNSYGHQQSKKKDEISGQYSILLPDGRIQTTKYFADDSGFHADVSYSTIHHK